MKFKMAVEMEFDDIPMLWQGRVDEVCESIAKTVVNETASNMTTLGIGVKYEGCSWLEEHEKGYADGILFWE